MAIDQIDAKVLRARRAFSRSKRAIAAACDDLEEHKLWLDHHRAGWAEAVKLCERRLSTKLRIRAFQRLVWGIFLVAPILCLALYRLTARFLPRVRSEVLVRCTWRPNVPDLSSWLRIRSRHRISGLDGPLCLGQPSPRTVIPRSEIGLFKVRLFVAAFGAVIVGFLAAATTPDRPSEPAQVRSPTTPVQPPQSALVPTVASSKALVREEQAPIRTTGFTTLEATTATPALSLPGATIAELISITSPLAGYADAATEPEVTPPLRKPKLTANTKAKPKRHLTKQKQITFWDQLPWRR